MKDDILSTAATLFLNLGFKGVTMDDIAHEMGISKKTIYEHFDHKTELVQEVSMLYKAENRTNIPVLLNAFLRSIL